MQAIGKVLFEGFNKSFVNYNSPDHAMIAHIRANVFAFSHAKSLVQMKALTNLVVDNELIRSFGDFQKEAEKIGNQFNSNYLKTEYNSTVASGQMARRYQEVIADKDVFPLLRWRAVGDARTRPEHLRLDGITRPTDDEFWHSYWPPAGHGCRCDIEQARSGRLTPKANANTIAKSVVDSKSPFIGNSAVKGEVFSIHHPYFTGTKSTQRTLSDLKPNDYGLRSTNKIYSKSNQPSLKQGFTTKKAWLNHFDKLTEKDGNLAGKDILDRPWSMNANAIGTRYDLGGTVLDVLTKPDEVYSTYQGISKIEYKYIKFYKNKPVTVVVAPDGKNMNVKSVTDTGIDQKRKGILHYVDRY